MGDLNRKLGQNYILIGDDYQTIQSDEFEMTLLKTRKFK